MSLFSEEQLKELETVFCLKRVVSLPVRDGRVTETDMVWWRNKNSPERVEAIAHWQNIQGFPGAYSIREPSTKVVYLD